VAIDTPVFELRETLMGKYGEDSKLIYDLADQVRLESKLAHNHPLHITLAYIGVFTLTRAAVRGGVVSDDEGTSALGWCGRLVDVGVAVLAVRRY
jgi:hypothetical protein